MQDGISKRMGLVGIVSWSTHLLDYGDQDGIGKERQGSTESVAEDMNRLEG